ncbi:PUS7 [Candida oxycetoniae]|uniref:PUS7 n=1 Tax=Candida oxycetoniae TaxID=497107 RepID=A0AAI9SUR8_9ASCO|nr:PUS7 [Candida oxycetoniae]KAI3403441.1 PUS7 [Candida oxycetoniae]
MSEQLKRIVSSEEIVSSVKKQKKISTSGVASAITEADVGITRFVNSQTIGFQAAIKTLYSDFQVNEIQPNGTVVHLVDEGLETGKSNREKRLEKRAKEREELKGKSQEEIAKIMEEREALKENEPKYTLSEEDKTELLSYITNEELQNIEDLFSTGNNTETKTQFHDKEQRTKLHQLFRKAFQGKLETVTSSENTFRIAIAKRKGGFSRGDARNSNGQESMHHIDENGVVNYGLGPFKPYLHFTVFKKNRDTMDVANTIAKMIRVPNKSITFAGTKDRRGVTCQRFSIHRGKVLRVNALNKMPNSNFKLGSFTYEDEPLKLGDLLGNEFLITLRDVKPVSSISTLISANDDVNIKDIIEQSFTSLKQKGFINYFGMQRFGSFSVQTHELGAALLQEDWQKCVDLLLSEQEITAPGTLDARKVWADTKDARKAMKVLPRHYVAEYSILKTLANEKQNQDGSFNRHSYFQSILAIPKNLRMMYVHAYQSYVWNLVTSKRIEMFGLQVQEGDLVLEEETTSLNKSCDPVKDEDDFEEDVAESREVPVRAITKEDIESNRYTIFDVVLPTPGYMVQYPTNEKLVQVYIDTMSRDNIDPFNLTRKNKEFSLTGTYRKIVTKPIDLSYDLISYSDDSALLVRTDEEIYEMKKEELKEGKSVEEIGRLIPQLKDATADGDAGDAAGDAATATTATATPEKLAVVLKMQLGVSSYATMALREFMKIDTTRNEAL